MWCYPEVLVSKGIMGVKKSSCERFHVARTCGLIHRSYAAFIHNFMRAQHFAIHYARNSVKGN